jgi:hypothetical protein
VKQAISAPVDLAAIIGFAIAQASQGSENVPIAPRNNNGVPKTLSDGTKTDLSPHNRATPAPRTIPNDKSVIQRDGKPQK